MFGLEKTIQSGLNILEDTLTLEAPKKEDIARVGAGVLVGWFGMEIIETFTEDKEEE